MMFFSNNNQKQHTDIHNYEVMSDNGKVKLQRIKITKISDVGDIETEETTQAVIIDDIKISSISEIFGKCHDCGGYVTHLSKRICFCGKIICTTCSEWWDDDNRPVCAECFNSLKKKKFWGAFWHLLISPFIERREG